MRNISKEKISTVDSAQFFLSQLASGREVETAKIYCMLYLLERDMRMKAKTPYLQDGFTRGAIPIPDKLSTVLYAMPQQSLLYSYHNLGGDYSYFTDLDKNIHHHIIAMYGNKPLYVLQDVVKSDYYFQSTKYGEHITFENT